MKYIYALSIGALTAVVVSIWVNTLVELRNDLREPVRASESIVRSTWDAPRYPHAIQYTETVWQAQPTIIDDQLQGGLNGLQKHN